MSTMMLPAIMGNADHELAETVPRVPAGRAPRRYMDFISRSYRLRGIASFLLTGSLQALADDFQKSATAWLCFLRSARDEEKAASRATALFCAVACKDFDTATEIARHSRYTFNRDEEYEDDFLYVALLMRRFLLGADDAESQQWVARLEAFLKGEPSPRLDVCRALLARDGNAFEDALQRRIAEHRAWLALAQERDALLEEEYATDGQLFVEGLALVCLAEKTGLLVAEEHPLVPGIARRARARELGPDTWRRFEAE